MTDDEKLQRLIDEGVFDPELLPEEYEAIIRGLTPNEVEVISSINKRMLHVEQLIERGEPVANFGKF